jgi:hypothetical protein
MRHVKVFSSWRSNGTSTHSLGRLALIVVISRARVFGGNAADEEIDNSIGVPTNARENSSRPVG